MAKSTKKTATKKRSAKKAATKKTSRRAGKVNKSQAIRDYKNANADAGPTAIMQALAKQGVKVTAQQVSTVLSNDARKNGRASKRRGRRKAAPTARKSVATRSNDNVSLSALLATQQFVDKVGGVDSAKELLGALEKLSK